jgi:hypothetical protein
MGTIVTAAVLWILWSQTGSATVDQLGQTLSSYTYSYTRAAWDPIAAFSTKSECEVEESKRQLIAITRWTEKIQEARRRAGQWYTRPKLSSLLHPRSEETEEAQYPQVQPSDRFPLVVYRCLPDTIDPRGPKEK